MWSRAASSCCGHSGNSSASPAPASAAEGTGERKQIGTWDKAAIGIVGIDDDGKAGVGELEKIADFDRRMTNERRNTDMLGIGRAEDRGAAGLFQ